MKRPERVQGCFVGGIYCVVNDSVLFASPKGAILGNFGSKLLIF